ncbi:RES family NAD+ phosphorylase [Pelagibius sp. Alg239-R121]|uniref:RES family NAD+ phosphorylase n=1 Tax=Pelagibius sp. Alg239-R121 TaxID=2993448 RepID=UPI0024A6DD0E|nr:RES family NAD+ phosphorylase [Pelagibius sp. Alg239-R121]
MLTDVSGRFVKIALSGVDIDIHLERGRSCRPPARFNRKGQDALYLSPNEESARVAIGQYVVEGGPPRGLFTFEVDYCKLFDLRNPQAAPVYEDARQPWQCELEAERIPRSWGAADELRNAGHLGLIDPSRRRPGLWHITLFRWNEPGAPSVRMVGNPRPIEIIPNYR